MVTVTSHFIVALCTTDDKQIDTDAFELQEIKRMEQSFYVMTFFIL